MSKYTQEELQLSRRISLSSAPNHAYKNALGKSKWACHILVALYAAHVTGVKRIGKLTLSEIFGDKYAFGKKVKKAVDTLAKEGLVNTCRDVPDDGFRSNKHMSCVYLTDKGRGVVMKWLK